MKYTERNNLGIRPSYNKKNSKLFKEREMELERMIGADKNFLKDKYPHEGFYYDRQCFYRTDTGYLNIKPQYRRGYNEIKM